MPNLGQATGGPRRREAPPPSTPPPDPRRGSLGSRPRVARPDAGSDRRPEARDGCVQSQGEPFLKRVSLGVFGSFQELPVWESVKSVVTLKVTNEIKNIQKDNRTGSSQKRHKCSNLPGIDSRPESHLYPWSHPFLERPPRTRTITSPCM